MQRIILPALIAVLAACQPSTGPQEQSVAPTTDDMMVTREAVDHSLGVDALPGEASAAAASQEAAIGAPDALLRDWAEALEAGDWRRAYAAWGENGLASGMTPEDYAASFERFASIEIDVTDGKLSAKDGVETYRAMAVMTGELLNEKPYRMEGPVTLARAEPLIEASAQERRWHIESAELLPRAAPEASFENVALAVD